MQAIMQFYDGEIPTKSVTISANILLESSNVVWIILFYNILIDHHCKIMSESLFKITFVRIV